MRSRYHIVFKRRVEEGCVHGEDAGNGLGVSSSGVSQVNYIEIFGCNLDHVFAFLLPNQSENHGEQLRKQRQHVREQEVKTEENRRKGCVVSY